MIRIKESRCEKGLTCQHVATQVGISRSAYSNIENGKRRPSVDTAKKIAAVLGFDWTRFFDEDEG